jgi:hypothetical protein
VLKILLPTGPIAEPFYRQGSNPFKPVPISVLFSGFQLKDSEIEKWNGELIQIIIKRSTRH